VRLTENEKLNQSVSTVSLPVTSLTW